MAEHYNQEAEYSILGALLLDGALLPQMLDTLTLQDFYFTSSRLTIQAMIELQESGRPIDPVLLADSLERAGKLKQVGGHVFIAQVMDMVPSSALLPHYCEIVKDHAVTRRVMEAAGRIIQEADTLPVGCSEELVTIAQREIMGVNSGVSDNGDIRSLAKAAFEKIEERYNSGGGLPGISTGFRTLDLLTGGLKKGGLYIVAGRPGSGKTALSLCLTLTAAKSGSNSAFYSLEMPRIEITLRAISSLSGVNSHTMSQGYLSPEEWGKTARTADALSRMLITIDDSVTGIDKIATRARRQHTERPLDMVIVDYLQLVRPSRRMNNREQEVSEVSRSLKALAKELDIPVIAGAQLNRAVETRRDSKPILADLRESGAIEQDADVIMFLSPTDSDGGTVLDVAKNRQGPTGEASLFFDRKTTTFREVTNVYAGIPDKRAEEKD